MEKKEIGAVIVGHAGHGYMGRVIAAHMPDHSPLLIVCSGSISEDVQHLLEAKSFTITNHRDDFDRKLSQREMHREFSKMENNLNGGKRSKGRKKNITKEGSNFTPKKKKRKK